MSVPVGPFIPQESFELSSPNSGVTTPDGYEAKDVEVFINDENQNKTIDKWDASTIQGLVKNTNPSRMDQQDAFHVKDPSLSSILKIDNNQRLVGTTHSDFQDNVNLLTQSSNSLDAGQFGKAKKYMRKTFRHGNQVGIERDKASLKHEVGLINEDKKAAKASVQSDLKAPTKPIDKITTAIRTIRDAHQGNQTSAGERLYEFAMKPTKEEESYKPEDSGRMLEMEEQIKNEKYDGFIEI
jgi:hypothetical protein